jgi:hypothetical protein
MKFFFACTSDGLQAHILPNLMETKLYPQRSGITKTVHWIDTCDSSSCMVLVLLLFRLWTTLSNNSWNVST